MNKDDLLGDVQALLRKSIASRLKIPRADYDYSLDVQTAVNHCLTNVMAIGYSGKIDAAVKDICETRYYMDNLDETALKDIKTEIIGTHNTFSVEIAVFTKMHAMNQADVEPTEIWAFVQSALVVDDEYKA